ncbi:MAG: PepSY-associated TM helix domain-containing protein [Gammaproteobacteria bacterium]
MSIKKVHRILGLFTATLWMFQAFTGVLLTFRQEIDNASVAGEAVPVATAGLGERIASLQRGGSRVESMWVTNFAANRFNIHYVDAATTERVMLVDGAGRVLRDGLENTTFANGGWSGTLTNLHASLMSEEVGKWIIGICGALLVSNIVLGLKLAWPRKGMWRQALVLRSSRNATAQLYGVHRTVGLWMAVPLFVVAAAGVALRFDDALERALGVARAVPVNSAQVSGFQPAQALDLALARYRNSMITALSMPTESAPWYRVRVHARGEVSRMYGTTTVYLSAVDGAVLKEYPAATASAGRAVFDTLYPIHTGEIGGLAGRVLLLLTGVALLFTGVYGIRLWLARLKRKKPSIAGRLGGETPNDNL